jgi:hypothetical protein
MPLPLRFTSCALSLIASLAAPAWADDVEQQEIIVTGQAEGYRASETTSGTKTSTPILDVPQSISVVTLILSVIFPVSARGKAKDTEIRSRCVATIRPPTSLWMASATTHSIFVASITSTEWKRTKAPMP